MVWPKRTGTRGTAAGHTAAGGALRAQATHPDWPNQRAEGWFSACRAQCPKLLSAVRAARITVPMASGPLRPAVAPLPSHQTGHIAPLLPQCTHQASGCFHWRSTRRPLRNPERKHVAAVVVVPVRGVHHIGRGLPPFGTAAVRADLACRLHCAAAGAAASASAGVGPGATDTGATSGAAAVKAVATADESPRATDTGAASRLAATGPGPAACACMRLRVRRSHTAGRGGGAASAGPTTGPTADG